MAHIDKVLRLLLQASVSLVLGGGSVTGNAQTMAADNHPGGIEEVVVSVRKREETSIAVPASVTAMNQAMLDKQGVRSFQDIAVLVPSLTVGTSSAIGGTIVLRGVGTTAGSNASFEQTVTTNIDGIQLGRGNIVRVGQIDLGTVEVLRGPQALFFGKNSPAGVISLRSADPTDRFDALARVGYEANGREKTVDGVISGPVTDILKLRLAGSFSDSGGWLENDAHKASGANAIMPDIVTPLADRGPQDRFYFVRGTVLLDPSDDLSLRGKFAYSETDGISYVQAGSFQRIYCPNGQPSTLGQLVGAGITQPTAGVLATATAVDDCKPNGHYTQGSISPAALAAAATGPYAISGVSDPKGESNSELTIGSLEVNYSLSDAFKLASISGSASLREHRADSFSYSPYDATRALDFFLVNNYRQDSEELRLSTNLDDSPVNGVVGLYYDRSRLEVITRNLTGALPPVGQVLRGETLSAFGQLRWNIVSTVELAGGARWTEETKRFAVTRDTIQGNLDVPDSTFSNVSPEATLTWRPSQDLTLYGAYKQGFKSGGYATPFVGSPVLPATIVTQRFRPEEARGAELGLKIRALDGRLRVNVAGYYYDYTDLQVTSFDNSSVVAVIKVTNAASARVKGLEGDFVWYPAGLEGFELHGALNYNQARYTDYVAPCYVGQTIEAGCSLLVNNATGRFTSQDLSGRPFVNAPDWSGSLGYSYTGQIGDSDLSFGLSGDVNYKSRFTPNADQVPGASQAKASFLNASARLFGPGWEVAVLGKNLTNVYRANASLAVGFTGNAALTGSNTPGGLQDLTGSVNRGRELWLQITMRPVQWRRW